MSAASTPAPPTATPIDCETAVRRLWDYLDARLPAAAAEEVEAHLAACADCPPHFAFARRVQRALAAARTAPAPTSEALRARVVAALRTARGDAAGGEADAGNAGAPH